MGQSSDQIWNKRSLPSIRTKLALVVLACMVPAVMSFVLLTYNSYERERTQFERDTLLIARALVLAVDRDLEGCKMAALALATSPSLTTNNLSAFHAQATSLLNDAFPGFTFVLSDQTGQQLVNTIRPLGQPLPYHGNLDQLRQVFAIGKSIVSDIYIGGVLRQPIIGIDVPVWRDGTVVYDLTVGILPERIGKILTEQRVPAGSIIAIFDTKGTIVARTHDPKKFIGQKGAPEILERIRQTNEGALDMVSVEGIPVYSIFNRSPESGWTVAIGTPKSIVQAELLQTVAWMSVVVVTLLASGFTLAYYHGLAISHSVKALSSSATALGASGTVQKLPMSFREADEVAEELLHHRCKLENLVDERTQQLETSKALLAQLTAANETLQIEIFDRKHAEDALQESEQRLKLHLENSPLAVVEWDADFIVTQWSKEAERMFGWSREEVLAKRIDTLNMVYPEDASKVARTIERLTSGKELTVISSNRNLNKSGGVIECIWHNSILLDPSGKMTSVMSLVEDITERRRAEEQVKVSLAEKEVMLKEIHHRVKNNLQVISSLVSLQADSLTDESMREEFEDVCDRVRSMALIHEKLYQTGDLAQLNFGDYATSLLQFLWETYDVLAENVQLKLLVEPIMLTIETAVPCGLILNELAGNALKHAFPNNSGGEVTVILGQDRSTNTACLRVHDNGIGLPTGLDWRQSSSLGLRLVDILAGQLGGTVETGTGPGADFRVTFALNGF